MLNKVPLLVIILIIIFIITSLMTFITMEDVITPEKITIEEVKDQGSANVIIGLKDQEGANVRIDIVGPTET